MEITIKKRAAENLDYEHDHLSSLPDGLLHYILSFLETKDVVLTGILSRRWRDLSASVPNLHFHSPLNGDEDDFVRFVDLALLLNSAPKIWKFHLWFRYREYYVSHVDSWIDFAMRKGVKELDLGFPYNLGSFGNDSYKLPSRVLNCESLISLRLRNCRLEASNFVNLPKLTALSLVFEALGDGMVEELLKGCPMLEDLVIKASSYNSFPPIKICSSSSSWLQLKRLAIVGVDNPRVDIEAPNLQILKISTGRFGEYFFEDMPFLREAELSFSYIPERTKGCISSLESSLPNIRYARVLKLCSTCVQAMPIPTFNDLSSYFFKAKCLTLSSGLQKYEIPGIANLLQRSPDLENLIIDLGPSTCVNEQERFVQYDFDEKEYWESLTVTFPCLVHHLKTIKIINFMGEGRLHSSLKVTNFHEKDEQIKLVKFLLKNAMVLEKMTLHVCNRPKYVKVEQWPEILLRVTQKLVAFPRASSRAEVIFSYK